MPGKTKCKFRICGHRMHKDDWSLGFNLTHDGDFKETYFCINLIIWSVQIGWME